MEPSIRAQVITRRTYNRPIEGYPGEFETWTETISRVIGHQRWLWLRAAGVERLNAEQEAELEELRSLLLERSISLSGRTLWLGGTEVSKKREASQFNCAGRRVETVHDVVDLYHLLLQGCGTGFEPVVGTLNGFTRPCELEIIRSTQTDKNFRGRPTNQETFQDGHLTISVGDSAEAWAKFPGKLLADKRSFKKLTIDFSQIRPAGTRLRSYGWISSGDEQIAKATEGIWKIMCERASCLLTRINIMDIINWLGSTLSSRRSAEITLMPYGNPEWIDFAKAKKDYYKNGQPQRGQSNNSILFYHKPSSAELLDIFDLMLDAGGSEPGFINAAAALKRAPWFKTVNPCAEILLGNGSFCNLVEVDLAKFNGQWDSLIRAIRLAARACYRQTCVNLDDGILQRTWHELNEFLRLTGVGLTGIVRWEKGGDAASYRALKYQAHLAAHSMADELGLPRSRAVTTVKPSGTLSKIMDTTEGLHKPLGRYIINNVKFSKHDPLVERCRRAGYKVFDEPNDPSAALVAFPVDWSDVDFDLAIARDGRTLNINRDTAVDQLERYKLLMDNYVDHNASITVSYDPKEVPDIVHWLTYNWDHYVGVSFMLRADATKTAEDLGFPYLPQEVVTKEFYDQYLAKLKPLDNDDHEAGIADIIDEACSTGACPIR